MTCLVELLVRVLDRRSARRIWPSWPRKWGANTARELAGDARHSRPNRDTKKPLQALAKVMGGVGFEISAEPDGERLMTSHCPFGEAATGHPEVVCSLDRGMVAGIMGVLHQECRPVLIPHRDARLRIASPRSRSPSGAVRQELARSTATTVDTLDHNGI